MCQREQSRRCIMTANWPGRCQGWCVLFIVASRGNSLLFIKQGDLIAYNRRHVKKLVLCRIWRLGSGTFTQIHKSFIWIREKQSQPAAKCSFYQTGFCCFHLISGHCSSQLFFIRPMQSEGCYLPLTGYSTSPVRHQCVTAWYGDSFGSFSDRILQDTFAF